MKKLNDRQTERRTFLSGDHVLLLLPVIATPCCRAGKQLCHVNLLKLYFFRADMAENRSWVYQVPVLHVWLRTFPLGWRGAGGEGHARS